MRTGGLCPTLRLLRDRTGGLRLTGRLRRPKLLSLAKYSMLSSAFFALATLCLLMSFIATPIGIKVLATCLVLYFIWMKPTTWYCDAIDIFAIVVNEPTAYKEEPLCPDTEETDTILPEKMMCEMSDDIKFDNEF